MPEITKPSPQFTNAQTLVAEVAIESLAYLKQVSAMLNIAIDDLTIGDIHRFQNLETPRVEQRPQCPKCGDRTRKNGSRIKEGVRQQQWVCGRCHKVLHQDL